MVYPQNINMFFIKTILIVKFLMILIGVDAQDETYNITYYTTDDGLSQNQVTDILCDNDGFMWFATWGGGLNKFDGYNFTHYKPLEKDSNCILSPSVECIFQDSKGYIWIGTKTEGLERYDPVKDEFYYYKYSNSNDSASLSDKRITSFCEDNQGRLWIGTWNGGINLYNYKTNSFKHYLNNLRIYKIIQTRDSTIWAGTYYEINNYDPHKDRFIKNEYIKSVGAISIVEDPDDPVIYYGGWGDYFFKFNYDEKSLKRLSLNNVYSMNFDSKGNLLIGTWGNGLYRLDKLNNEIKKINLIDENNLRYRYYNVILDIFNDDRNNIWLGLENGGVCKLSEKLQFKTITYSNKYDKDIKLSNISSVVEDDKGNLWIGTYGAGLFCSPDRKLVYKVKLPDNTKIINAILKHDDRKVWIVTENFISELKWKNNRAFFERIENIYKTGPNFVIPYKPTSILKEDNVYWIGTQRNGLFLFEISENNRLNLIKNYKANAEDKKRLNNERVSCLFKDAEGNIWVGTYGGLHLFEKSDSSFIRIEDLLEKNEKFTCNIICSINQDMQGNLWVGTPCGLHKLTKTKQNYRLKIFNKRDGLSDETINSIVFDNANNLWLSNNSGISKFDPDDGAFRNYNRGNGILAGFYNPEAVYKNEQGIIFMGGEIGLTYFNPEDIVENNVTSKIAFTALNIWNNQVSVGQEINNRVILPRNLNNMREISLTRKETEFSVEIALLDYAVPGENQYAYMLKGRDEHWNYLGPRRWMSFSNLKPGKYILKVKASNSNNIWNEEGRSLIINVLPSWWETWYFKIGCLAIIIGSIIVFYFIRINSIEQQKKELENEVQKRTKEIKQKNKLLNETNTLLESRQKFIEEQTVELSEKNAELQKLVATKDKFFSIIAHDLKNPFNTVLGFSELLKLRCEQFGDTEFGKITESLYFSASKVYDLLENLLHWSLSQSGKIKYNPENFHILDIINENIELLKNLIEQKDLSVNIDIPVDLQVYADRQMINTIVRNILTNAVKFTKDGSISINSERDDNVIKIKIKDTGIGIPAEQLATLFEIDSSGLAQDTRKGSGTGLGLIICKEFIEINKGEIFVTSELGKGTEFIFTLPVQ